MTWRAVRPVNDPLFKKSDDGDLVGLQVQFLESGNRAVESPLLMTEIRLLYKYKYTTGER